MAPSIQIVVLVIQLRVTIFFFKCYIESIYTLVGGRPPPAVPVSFGLNPSALDANDLIVGKSFKDLTRNKDDGD